MSECCFHCMPESIGVAAWYVETCEVIEPTTHGCSSFFAVSQFLRQMSTAAVAWWELCSSFRHLGRTMPSGIMSFIRGTRYNWKEFCSFCSHSWGDMSAGCGTFFWNVASSWCFGYITASSIRYTKQQLARWQIYGPHCSHWCWGRLYIAPRKNFKPIFVGSRYSPFQFNFNKSIYVNVSLRKDICDGGYQGKKKSHVTHAMTSSLGWCHCMSDCPWRTVW